MSYHHKSHHSARVKHILASHSGQGKAPPKKRSGGACGTSRIYARGNDSAEHMQDMPAEGHKGKSRYAKGGKVHRPLKVNVINAHIHPPMGPAGGPPMAPGGGMAPPMPPPGGPGLMAPGMAPGMPPQMRNQGGAVSYGSGTGMSRLAEYHRMKGEGH
jgi:hypothetical protein